ncbi:MAG: gliding motility-associated C-terminal domain-containing protein [Bacteroidota bacterium]
MKPTIVVLFRVLLSSALFFSSYTLGAQLVVNGTFSGAIGTTSLPFGWVNCDEESSVEIQPGLWSVNLPPYDGDSYLGMVCRGENELVPNSCEEILRDLSEPLDIDSCYQLEIFLAYAANFQVSRFRAPIYLDIYLATEPCLDEPPIASFGPISHTDWRSYTATFTASDRHIIVWLRASTGGEPFYSGNILADQLSIQKTSLPTLDLGPDLERCPGDVVVLDASQSGDTFLWQDGSTTPTFTINDGGVYSVASTSACGIVEDSVQVNYGALPLPSGLPSDTSFCLGESLTLSVDQEDYDEILWQDTVLAPTFLVEEAGDYQLTLSTECGERTETIRVTNIETPAFTLGADLVLCEGETLELSVPDDIVEFTWEDLSTERIRLITEGGSYLLRATNACGSSIHAINVTLDPCDCFLYVPNAFSPNRDGVNDDFGPGFACAMLDYQLTIFDRWGNQVFESDDANRFWDGTFRGSLMATGAYVYVMTYQFENNPPAQEQGVVTLVR